MPAYLIANVDVHDHGRYERYRELVPATIEKFGGRYLARGGAVEVLEGSLPLKRFVIVEFPSSEAAKAWWASEEYGPVKQVGHETATSVLIVVGGI